MSFDVGISIRNGKLPSGKIELAEFSCSSGEELSQIGEFDSLESAMVRLEKLLENNPYEGVKVKGFRK